MGQERSERRTRANRFLMPAVGLAVTCVLVFVGLVLPAGRAWRQTPDVGQALAAARMEAGEGRLSQALRLLSPFLNSEEAASVEPTVRVLLGWAQPAAAQIAAMERPRLASYRGALILIDGRGSLHDLSELGGRGTRAILARDLRRLLLVGYHKSLVVDAQNGAVLAELPNDRITWDSFAFETSRGLLVVLGTHYGSTNGAVVHWMLSVSPDGETAMANYVSHWESLQGLSISGACNALLVTQDDGEIALPFEVRSLGEARPLTAFRAAFPGQVVRPIWRLGGQDMPDTSPFTDQMTGAEPRLYNPFVQAGCLAVAADNGTSDLDPNIVEVEHIGSEVSGETWDPLTGIPALYRPAPEPSEHHMPTPSDVNRLASVSVWRSLPSPRGVPPELDRFDVVEGRFLTFGEDHANAGVTWFVCDVRCLSVSALHDPATSYETVRSPDGAYLLIVQAGAIIDLKRLELVTDLFELPIRRGNAFDFEPDATQLAIIDRGEIVAYRPREDGTAPNSG
jgi:hypothetical protein